MILSCCGRSWRGGRRSPDRAKQASAWRRSPWRVATTTQRSSEPLTCWALSCGRSSELVESGFGLTMEREPRKHDRAASFRRNRSRWAGSTPRAVWRSRLADRPRAGESFTNDQPLTSRTAERPQERSRSKPQIVCPKARTTFRALLDPGEDQRVACSPRWLRSTLPSTTELLRASACAYTTHRVHFDVGALGGWIGLQQEVRVRQNCVGAHLGLRQFLADVEPPSWIRVKCSSG